MINILWDLRQDQNIAAAHSTASASLGESRDARYAVRSIEDRFDRLLLVCQAMWTFIREQTNLTEADLVRRVTELDMMDGSPDGRLTRAIVKCAKCDSAVCLKYNRCLFCGEPYKGGSAFSTI
jgi:hypothetical protein